jgi:hypothetical protein
MAVDERKNDALFHENSQGVFIRTKAEVER